ncbi:MAG: GNAT family N-acetyltransferase [Gemmatimonadota bacterium]
MAVAAVKFERVFSAALVGDLQKSVLRLLGDAYSDNLADYLRNVGRGVHLLGRVDGELVTHGMIVDRGLQVGEQPPLRTAYVELVATAPRAQGRGYASALMVHLVEHMAEYALAALSPVNVGFYQQFGWEKWRGPLSVRSNFHTVRTPEDEVMILRLPRTPETLDLDAPLSVEWRPGEVW